MAGRVVSSLLFSIGVPLAEPVVQVRVRVLPDEPNTLRLELEHRDTQGEFVYADLPRFVLGGLVQLFADFLNMPQRYPLVWRSGGEL